MFEIWDWDWEVCEGVMDVGDWDWDWEGTSRWVLELELVSGLEEGKLDSDAEEGPCLISA